MKFVTMILVCIALVGCQEKQTTIVTTEDEFAPFVSAIEDNQAGHLHSLLVWQDGVKRLELYRTGPGMYASQLKPNVPTGPGALHNVHSITKSFVATLIFIAIDEGKLASLDTLVFSLFPEYQAQDRAAKMAITVRDVMNMSTGYALDELAVPYGIGNPFNRHYHAKDLLNQFLTTSLAFEPGAKFCYSGLSTVGLSKIIERLYDQPFNQIMKEKLFTPLGISNYQWTGQLGSGEAGADWGLMLDTEGLSKFGLLWLNSGKWQGRQIVSERWQPLLHRGRFFSHGVGYKLHFWQVPRVSGAFAAFGYGEQYVLVIPSKNAVIVTTAGNYQNKGTPVLDLVEKINWKL